MTTETRDIDDQLRKSEGADASNNQKVDVKGATIVQVEALGKHGLLLLIICAMISAFSATGFMFVLFELKTVNARYAILQYDQQALKAQLVARGLYQGTEH